MKITAITKIKQGDIWLALKRLNWSQSELARRTGVSIQHIGVIINMKRRPPEELAEKIQRVFAEAGEYVDVLSVWPESFKGFEKSPVFEETKEVDNAVLLMQSDPVRMLEIKESGEIIEHVMSKYLTEREKDVIEKVFYDEKTLKEVADGYQVSQERIRQIEYKALKKIQMRLGRKFIDG